MKPTTESWFCYAYMGSVQNPQWIYFHFRCCTQKHVSCCRFCMWKHVSVSDFVQASNATTKIHFLYGMRTTYKINNENMFPLQYQVCKKYKMNTHFCIQNLQEKHVSILYFVQPPVLQHKYIFFVVDFICGYYNGIVLCRKGIFENY